jgi:hypothetical protein
MKSSRASKIAMDAYDADNLKIPDFTYRSLENPSRIRVLILDPGVGTMPLKGDLRHMDLSQPRSEEKRHT